MPTPIFASLSMYVGGAVAFEGGKEDAVGSGLAGDKKACDEVAKVKFCTGMSGVRGTLTPLPVHDENPRKSRNEEPAFSRTSELASDDELKTENADSSEISEPEVVTHVPFDVNSLAIAYAVNTM